jgi:hypothetical protein
MRGLPQQELDVILRPLALRDVSRDDRKAFNITVRVR